MTENERKLEEFIDSREFNSIIQNLKNSMTNILDPDKKDQKTALQCVFTAIIAAITGIIKNDNLLNDQEKYSAITNACIMLVSESVLQFVKEPFHQEALDHFPKVLKLFFPKAIKISEEDKKSSNGQ